MCKENGQVKTFLHSLHTGGRKKGGYTGGKHGISLFWVQRKRKVFKIGKKEGVG